MNKKIVIVVIILVVILIGVSSVFLFKVRTENKTSDTMNEVAIKEIVEEKKEKSPLEKAEEEMDDYFIPAFEMAVELLEENVNDFHLANYRVTTTEGSYATEIDPETGEQTTTHLQFICESGYVIVLDGETGNFLKINDDTKKIEIDYDINDFMMTEDDDNYYLEKTKAEIAKPEDIEKEEVMYFYDIEENKKWAYVTITMNKSYMSRLVERAFEVEK